MSDNSVFNFSRRRFLKRSFACGTLATALSEQALSVPASKNQSKFTLWCAPGGFITPTDPSHEQDVVAFVKKCARYGVSHLIPGQGSRILVEDATAFPESDFT